jgi:hypothetical protein
MTQIGTDKEVVLKLGVLAVLNECAAPMEQYGRLLSLIARQ